MTFQRPAYEEVRIAHGGNTVTLRPSLRAATILEQRHGIPALVRALDECNTTIISEIIVTMTSRHDAAPFLLSLQGRALLHFFQSVRAPLAEAVSMLTPAPEPKAKQKKQTGKPVTWAEVYSALYDRATGWLGWTPEQAWNATPTEIDHAYRAHLDKLKAIHGDGTEKEARGNVDTEALSDLLKSDDLDPEFDRSGLHALKGKRRAV